MIRLKDLLEDISGQLRRLTKGNWQNIVSGDPVRIIDSGEYPSHIVGSRGVAQHVWTREHRARVKIITGPYKGKTLDFTLSDLEQLPNLKLEYERDYKDEYKKFQSSPKMKKYRAQLNKYNRKKGTYGNGDGKDASHKGGKIAGFESQSKNRGRREKSRTPGRKK